MARLKAILLAVLIAWSSPAAAADAVERWSAHIAEASARFAIPADWIRRVIRAESNGQTLLRGRPTVSPAGAMGLMQLMPATWREVRALLGLGSDPHDPRDNILAGTFYLRAMYERFGYPGLFAAYNAGPARYSAHLSTGRPLPSETRAYAAKLASAPPLRPLPVVGRTRMLFAVVPAARSASADSRSSANRPDTLFVQLGGASGF